MSTRFNIDCPTKDMTTTQFINLFKTMALVYGGLTKAPTVFQFLFKTLLSIIQVKGWTMARYKRKLDKTIAEAVQWFPGIEIEGVYEHPTKEMLCGCVLDEGNAWFENEEYGTNISPGDWVIKNVDSGWIYDETDESFRERWELDK